jgi:hypothetical protein
MSFGHRIQPHASILRTRTPNHDFRKPPDLLILHEIISLRINTYKTPKISRNAFIRIALKSTRINTSGAKDLKSRRINTSGNKDLKSFRINTSKKHPGGRVSRPKWIDFFDPPTSRKISSAAWRLRGLSQETLFAVTFRQELNRP